MEKRIEFLKKLRKQTSDYFRKKGYVTADCEYILRHYDDWDNNIILPEVAEYIKKTKRDLEEKHIPFPLHKYIHHGLSSQACLFNLLGSLVVNNKYKLVQSILVNSGMNLAGNINHLEFEHSDPNIFNEMQGQPTSIDLYSKTTENENIYIEFKFTESEFGSCSVYVNGDCDGANPFNDYNLCYLHREKDRSYLNLMEKYNLITNGENCIFTEFYQAYRLLLYTLENNGYFLLIYDERNPAFINPEGRGKFIRFKNMLPTSIRNKISSISIQKIINILENNSCIWLNEFKEKYM